MEHKFYENITGNVLEKSAEGGVVFIDKAYSDFSGSAICRITYRGTDRHGKKFAIAKPVLQVHPRLVKVCRVAANLALWADSLYKKNIEEAFPGFECRDLYSIVKLCERVGQDTLACFARSGKVLMSKFAVPYKSERLFAPGDDIHIVGDDGSLETKPCSWVYKNRENLVGHQVTSVGDKAENVRLVFKRAEA